ncbi:hypothetical protein Lalb_Chr19g0124681 [Lupinus albus]|uniref:Uncharacterized protein n=1 Tax=Lupinus albus TaxID=3870 RepID=A0A6A4P044_LUPAL|nr:hypothetical protein Lalb_Chr19g0124681 [Lupinus albus]
MVMKERDEELALFLEMRRREKNNEKNNLLLLQNSEELDLSDLGSNHGVANISKVASSMPKSKNGVEELLNSENDKSDYDWLLAPPDSPLFPTLEDSHISTKSETEIRNARPTALRPRVSNIQVESASRSNIASKHHAPKPVLGSSTNGNRRPSPSRGTTPATSRSSTPSRRPILPSSNKSSRPSTPTSRATITASVKQTAPPVRSSTPTRSTVRASTPLTYRPSMEAPKISQRSATPMLRSSTPSRILGVSAPPTRPSSASKARPAVTKNPVQSRGISPSVKCRPWEPSKMPGFSHDAPPNLKTSLPERPASVTRTRPGVPNSRSSTFQPGSDGKSKKQSITPLKGRASSGYGQSNISSMQVLSRARFTDNDNESPVLIGTKMVERVVNMRKLAPPKNEDHHFAHNNSHGKSSSSDSSGFGLTLSKKSLDMAMRHMDIKRSMKGNNLRPVVTSIPASSTYGARSASTSRSRTISVSDSPLATSSNASSEPSVNNNSASYAGSEAEENDFGSERGISSFSES